jgi:hypothetical protein
VAERPIPIELQSARDCAAARVPKLIRMGVDSRAGDRVCFVHVGTHKTGTTAIQRFLAANEAALAAAGTAYPRAGRVSPAYPGHHNLAHELYGDARFDASLGTLRDVVAEVAGAQRVCLSSEDFEYLHARPALLVALRDALAAAGLRPAIVVYVRAQADYLESLYAELVKHGLLLPFSYILDAAMSRGVVHHDDVWTFRFDYTALADRFASVFGPGATFVRHYRDDGSGGSLVRDFCGAIGIAAPAEPAADEAPAVYDNPRLTTGGVVAQLFRNTAADLGDDRVAAAGADLVARHPREAGVPFRPLAPADRARVAARFAGDNARLAQRWPAAAGLAARRPTELEPESARRARAFFERAEALRRTYAAAGGALRSGSASSG